MGQGVGSNTPTSCACDGAAARATNAPMIEAAQYVREFVVMPRLPVCPVQNVIVPDPI